MFKTCSIYKSSLSNSVLIWTKSSLYVRNQSPFQEPLAQAKIDEYLHWQHTNTRLQCAMYFQVSFQSKYQNKPIICLLLDQMVDTHNDSGTTKRKTGPKLPKRNGKSTERLGKNLA